MVIQDIDTLESYIRALISVAPYETNTTLLCPATQKARQYPDEVARCNRSARLITGMQGLGKTTLLHRTTFHQLIRLLQKEDLHTSLFIMISQVQTLRGPDGKALGFTVETFYHEPSRNLSFFSQPLCTTEETAALSNSVKLGRYVFFPEVFTKLSTWLAMEFSNQYTNLYLFIDELGILELNKQQGLWPLFERIALNQFEGLESIELVCTVRQDRCTMLKTYLQKHGYKVTITELS